MRILCADDDDIWVTILGRQLPKWGFEPVLARDGTQAREILLGDNPPALALLDWIMPGISGLDLCREVRATASERYTYLIVMTSRRDTADIIEGLAAGADDYLTKPIDFAELERRLVAARRIVDLTHSLASSRDQLRREAEERQRTESELVRAQKLEAMGMLASGIAHEINTPIQFVGDSIEFLSECLSAYRTLVADYRELHEAAKVRGEHTELLRKIEEAEDETDIAFIEEEADGAVARTREGIRRVGGIVSAMRSFARGRQSEKSLGNINRAIEDTLVVARNEYKYVAKVHTEFGEVPDIYCHVGDLSQVFLNLLVNAAHAIADANAAYERSSGDIYICTYYDAEQNRVVIEFRDTGTGIPQDIIERIFDPFFTTKHDGRGTGQGLALSRVIVVEKHEGQLEVYSIPGEGSTFRISLPCVREEPLGREEAA